MSQRWHRLSHVHPGSWPWLALAKARRSIYSKMDRLSAQASAEKRVHGAASISKLVSLKILHPDIFRTDFGKRFKETYPEEAFVLLERADQALDLRFDLLG